MRTSLGAVVVAVIGGLMPVGIPFVAESAAAGREPRAFPSGGCEDLDDDLHCDDVDPCINLGAGGSVSEVRLKLKKLTTSPGDDAVSLAASIAVPTSTIDPIANGLRLALRDDAINSTVLDALVPPGAEDPLTKTGWLVKAWGWSYRDPAHPLLGKTRIQIRAGEPGAFEVRVKSSAGKLDTPLTAPPKLSIVVDALIAPDGQCVEHVFTLAECFERKGGEVLLCP